jgi:ABC-type transporter Mla MlaB component
MCSDEHECRRCGAPDDGAVDLDVSWLVPADLNAVDALARLHVAAIRCGRWVRLHGVNSGLLELLDLVGLDDVLQLCPRCRSAPPRR